jgi:hypothetical protein
MLRKVLIWAFGGEVALVLCTGALVATIMVRGLAIRAGSLLVPFFVWGMYLWPLTCVFPIVAAVTLAVGVTRKDEWLVTIGTAECILLLIQMSLLTALARI